MKVIKAKNTGLSSEEVRRVADVVKNGGIIIYPTETLYGIGCDALDHEAVKKVFALKERDSSSVASVMVDSVETIKKYAEVGRLEEEFIKRYLPGPVTVILKVKPEYRSVFSSYTINEHNGVGFRVISKLNYINEICRVSGVPIISTSANKSSVGVEKPSFDLVINYFEKEKDQIDIAIDAGDLDSNIPSTVVDLTQSPYQVVRRGAGEITIY